MTDYRPVLYHSQLSASCARVRRALRRFDVDVDVRNVLLSRRHRQALRRIAGQVKVPCLVVGGTVVHEPDEIIKYIRLRYGDIPRGDPENGQRRR